MEDDDLRGYVFSEIPSGEKILKEGILKTMSLLRGSSATARMVYKYALTEKGVWMRSRGSFLSKGKTTFMSYTDLDHYEMRPYFEQPSCIFFPKGGRQPGNRIFFDDSDEVLKVLDMFLTRMNE